MQRLITWIFILSFVSSCLCVRWNFGTKNSVSNNVMDYGAHGDGKSDDAQAFLSAWNSTCAAEGEATLVIPSGKSFLVNNLILDGKNCKATSIHIQILGEIVAPTKEAWKDGSYWIKIEYVNNLIIDGSGTGLIDGNGAKWWECKSCPRAKILFLHDCNNLTMSDLAFKNGPGGHLSVNSCDGATFSNISINAPADSPNTDAILISNSKGIFVQNSMLSIGDDCIAIKAGSSNINATGITCGPGHGISIGCLGINGANQTVEKVYVSNCTFKGTTNGARIKTWKGGSGYARDITFEHIQLIDVQNPIIIDQKYGAKSTTGDSTSAVQVINVTYRDFNGTSLTDQAIKLDCSNLGCYHLTLDQINVVSANPKKHTVAFCNNAHGTVSKTVPSVPCMLPN